MKKAILVLQFITATISGYCQQPAPVIARETTILPALEISAQKTTSLIFPSAIKSVDRGSADVLVQIPTGVENVLKVKAAKPYFAETNLTAITADGAFYSFTVFYGNSPSQLVVQVKQSAGSTPPQTSTSTPALFSSANDNEKLTANLTAQAAVAKNNIRRVKDKTYEMTAALKGLYTAEDLFLYKLVLTNGSDVNYTIDAIRFFIEDKKKVKRTARQQITLEPIAIIGNETPVKAMEQRMVIITLPKQTIATEKQLVIEVVERNGGRNMVCTLDNKVLLKAVPLSSMPKL